jgi:O-acetyl-ADP-ribose deacetylase (regulator of RNase III)
MKVEAVRGDITVERVDAIVNAATAASFGELLQERGLL